MTNTTPPSLKLLMTHPAHFFALGFGTGLAKQAPGTFGTLMGLPLFLCISVCSLTCQLVIIAAFFSLGIYFCHKTGEALGVADHGSIVWDEIVAMMLVLTATPMDAMWWGVAFVLFRFFDIWKPAPIRQCDAAIKGGLGVMLDDILAAFYSIICLKGLLWLYPLNPI